MPSFAVGRAQELIYELQRLILAHEIPALPVYVDSPLATETVGVFRASDGPLYMACANDRLYRRLVTEVLDRPDLVTDPDFSHRKARTANKAAFRP